MKNLFILLFTLVLITSCEDIETNSPAVQATVDNIFFKAQSAHATTNDDGTFTIYGINAIEEMNLHISSPEPGTYHLGNGFPNTATFERTGGLIYSTSPEGEGSVIVTEWDNSGKTITGTFQFEAIITGLDTITVNDGIFYEVPYTTEEPEGL